MIFVRRKRLISKLLQEFIFVFIFCFSLIIRIIIERANVQEYMLEKIPGLTVQSLACSIINSIFIIIGLYSELGSSQEKVGAWRLLL